MFSQWLRSQCKTKNTNLQNINYGLAPSNVILHEKRFIISCFYEKFWHRPKIHGALEIITVYYVLVASWRWHRTRQSVNSE